MPQAIPLLTGYLVSGTVLAGTYLTGMGLALVQAAIGGVVAFGTSKLLGLDEQPDIPDPGIQANVSGTVAPIPIIYGRRRVGGVIAQIVTTGKVTSSITIPPLLPGSGTYPTDTQTDNKYLNIILCWGEGEIEEVYQVWFDDNLSTSEDFEGWFTAHHYLGTDDQAASTPFLTALSRTFDAESAARLWSTNHKLSGVAYSYFKLEYDRDAWPTGIPTITAEIKGRKVLDLRTDTWGWSDNPALIIYDYLTNTRFGRGIDAAELDTDSFIDAANYCDQEIYIETQASVPPDVPSAGVTQARYACDAILSPEDTTLDNLKVLLGTCRGFLVFSGGLYRLKLDKPETASFALTEDNIIGGWNILLENSQSRLNRVHAQWRDRNNKYQDDYAILESATYLAADQGEILEAKIDLPATTNAYRPIQMAGMVLRQSRYSLQVELTCTIEGLQVEVYDVVTVTHELPGWDGELFRVMAITLESQDVVRLQLQQYADEVYDLDNQNDEDSPPPTNLPDPRLVPGVEVFEIYLFSTVAGDGSTRDYIQPVWRSTYDSPNLEAFRLRWRPVGTDPWQFIELPIDAVYSEGIGQRYQTIDIDIYRGTLYEIEIRCVNRLGVEGEAYTNDTILIGSLIPAAPGKPTSVRAAGYVSGNVITWTKGARATLTEIYRTTGGLDDYDSGNAELIATTDGTSHIDVLAWGTVANYWLRSFNPGGYSDLQPDTDSLSLVSTAGLQTYADDIAAGAAGLLTGDMYLDPSGNVRVKA